MDVALACWELGPECVITGILVTRKLRVRNENVQTFVALYLEQRG